MRSFAIEEPGSPVPALYATLLSAEHKCEQCNKTFAHNKTLKVHVQQQHERKKKSYKGGFVLWENNELPCKSSDIFSCEQCDYETERKTI